MPCLSRAPDVIKGNGKEEMTLSSAGHENGCVLVLSDGACLAGQEQTQGLDARTLFHLRDGRLEPGLQPLAVPVRSIVLPLGEGPVAARLAAALHTHLLPIFVAAGVWLQDPKKYHSTLFHASPHQVGPDDLGLDLMAAHGLSPHSDAALHEYVRTFLKLTVFLVIELIGCAPPPTTIK